MKAGVERSRLLRVAEVEGVGGFVGASLSEPTLQVGIFLSARLSMLFVEPTIAIVSLGFFLPELIFVPVLQRVVNRRARRKIQLIREVGELIVEGGNHRGVARYRDRLDRIYRVRVQYFGFKFLIKFLNNLMNHRAPLSVLMVGGYLRYRGGRPRSASWSRSSPASSVWPTRRVSSWCTIGSRPRPRFSIG